MYQFQVTKDYVVCFKIRERYVPLLCVTDIVALILFLFLICFQDLEFHSANWYVKGEDAPSIRGASIMYKRMGLIQLRALSIYVSSAFIFIY